MGEQNNKKVEACVKSGLDFLRDVDSVKILEIIIDIYDEIQYCKMDGESVRETFLKVLNNCVDSDTLHSLLEEDDIEILKSFIQDFLKVGCDSEGYFIGNQEFSQLTMDEIYNVLVKIKCLKKWNQKKLLGKPYKKSATYFAIDS